MAWSGLSAGRGLVNARKSRTTKLADKWRRSRFGATGCRHGGLVTDSPCGRLALECSSWPETALSRESTPVGNRRRNRRPVRVQVALVTQIGRASIASPSSTGFCACRPALRSSAASHLPVTGASEPRSHVLAPASISLTVGQRLSVSTSRTRRVCVSAGAAHLPSRPGCQVSYNRPSHCLGYHYPQPDCLPSPCCCARIILASFTGDSASITYPAAFARPSTHNCGNLLEQAVCLTCEA
jgi:hypothetical protein